MKVLCVMFIDPIHFISLGVDFNFQQLFSEMAYSTFNTFLLIIARCKQQLWMAETHKTRSVSCGILLKELSQGSLLTLKFYCGSTSAVGGSTVDSSLLMVF